MITADTIPADNQDRMSHWYCFSFNYAHNGAYGFCNTYTGFDMQGQFNRAIIEQQKGNAHPDAAKDNMVLIAITYLGYMTKAQFTKETT